MCACLLAAPPRGQAEQEHPAFVVAAEAGSDFPVAIAGRSVFTLPYGVQASVGVGFMPQGYTKVINATLVAAGAYERQTADLIEHAVGNSLYGEVRLGWDMGEPGGFFCAVGYSVMAFGGSVTAVALFESATGKTFSPLRSGPGLPLSTTVHNLSAQAGYEFELGQGFSAVTSVGLLKTVAASTTLDVSTRGILVQRAQAEISTYVNDTFVSYVVTPSLGLFVRYTF
jgi:hypothetical protein